MARKPHSVRQWLPVTLIIVTVSLIFLATTDDANIWPLRNLLYYRWTNWWEDRIDLSRPTGHGELYGCVRNEQGQPIPRASVLLSERDGTVHQTTASADGCYRISAVPAGRYVPLANATGHAAVAMQPWNLPVNIRADQRQQLDFTLPPVSLPLVQPGTNLQLSDAVTRTWDLPQPGMALRRQITYDSGGRPNQPTFLYTPITSTQRLPTLLTIYPGPAESWEGVSIPLAAAGYAVIAIGPAYTMELEADIDELQRLVAFTRAGQLPGADGQRIAVLGGSYSGLHVFRLIQRDNGFRGALLLGPPSDLFDLRRRFEAGSFFPPFGLDQALIALGRPNIATERYWRYSPIYHLRPDLPPLAILHSRDDEVVPFQQSEMLVAALARQGPAYEAHFFDGMSHYLLADRASPELTQLYNITLDFLQRTTGT